jgi:[histone H3]-lysine4 N-trimethyltransferase SETD1
MTRPSSAPSFEHFFPSAPKFKHKGHSTAQGDSPGSSRGTALTSDPNATGLIHQTHTAHQCDLSAITADESATPPSEIPGTVDSISSHASTVSSIFSNPVRPGAISTPSHLSTTASYTPRTNKDSPSYSLAAASSTPDMAPSSSDDYLTAQTTTVSTTINNNSWSSPSFSIHDHPPARDPASSIKGSKCTFDPLLDRQKKKAINKGSKPIYENFGLVCKMSSSSALHWGSVIFGCQDFG